jgi:AraC-like DNA-binding protein
MADNRARWPEGKALEAQPPPRALVVDLKPGTRLLTLSEAEAAVSERVAVPAKSLVLGCALDGQAALPPKGPSNTELVAAAEAGHLWLESGSPVAQVGLLIEAQTLAPLLAAQGELSELSRCLFSGRGDWREFSLKPLEADKRLIARQILACTLGGVWRRLFLEGKAMELLALFLGKAAQCEKRGAELNSDDKLKLERAKEVIEGNPASPPSLKTLSRICGLNENKVKRGFRELFGESVGSFARRKRMRLALDMLTSSSKPVGFVANFVGYSNTSHFIDAFRKEFGDTPGRLRRNRP